MAKGFGGMGGMFRDMQKQAADMQKRLADVQNDLKQRVYEGSAGGGAVTAIVNGHREILAVKIKPEVVDPQDVEMLQDMIIAAVGSALTQATEAYTQEMSKMAGGMPIPGLM